MTKPQDRTPLSAEELVREVAGLTAALDAVTEPGFATSVIGRLRALDATDEAAKEGSERGE